MRLLAAAAAVTSGTCTSIRMSAANKSQAHLICAARHDKSEVAAAPGRAAIVQRHHAEPPVGEKRRHLLRAARVAGGARVVQCEVGGEGVGEQGVVG